MPDYRRVRVPGGTYFFTVNLLERYPNDLLIRHIDALRESVRRVRRRYPFHIDAWVVLPDHLHAIWTLPEGDADYANRWRTIKQHFSRAIASTEYRSEVRIRRGERGIWQRRFWEHYDSRRPRFRGTLRLCPHQPREAWPCRASKGLAVFDLFPVRGGRNLSGRLGDCACRPGTTRRAP